MNFVQSVAVSHLAPGALKHRQAFLSSKARETVDGFFLPFTSV